MEATSNCAERAGLRIVERDCQDVAGRPFSFGQGLSVFEPRKPLPSPSARAKSEASTPSEVVVVSVHPAGVEVAPPRQGPRCRPPETCTSFGVVGMNSYAVEWPPIGARRDAGGSRDEHHGRLEPRADLSSCGARVGATPTLTIIPGAGLRGPDVGLPGGRMIFVGIGFAYPNPVNLILLSAGQSRTVPSY